MTDETVITKEVLDVGKIANAVVCDQAGGTSVFVGTTRDTFNDRRVMRLEYEAYEPMAVKEMRVLCDEARTKWIDLKHISVWHRIGVVPVGEASVIIAVSSPHRREAIEACHWMIDTLKARVPIWKKEIYDDGSEWKANAEFKPPQQH